MRTGAVVAVGPGSEGEVTLVGVGPVSGMAHSRTAVWMKRLALPFEAHLQTSLAKLLGATAAAVIGEQSNQPEKLLTRLLLLADNCCNQAWVLKKSVIGMSFRLR